LKRHSSFPCSAHTERGGPRSGEWLCKPEDTVTLPVLLMNSTPSCTQHNATFKLRSPLSSINFLKVVTVTTPHCEKFSKSDDEDSAESHTTRMVPTAPMVTVRRRLHFSESRPGPAPPHLYCGSRLYDQIEPCFFKLIKINRPRVACRVCERPGRQCTRRPRTGQAPRGLQAQGRPGGIEIHLHRL
jgi:hypothetical protein